MLLVVYQTPFDLPVKPKETHDVRKTKQETEHILDMNTFLRTCWLMC